jgi:hypothetical protein
MAGLDTRGFVSGAAQGFGLHQQYIDTERRRKREDQAMEWQVEDRETAAEDRQRTIGIQDEQMGWQRENQNFQSRQNSWAEFQQDFMPIMANYQQGDEITGDQWRVIARGNKQFPGRLPSDLAQASRARQAQQVIPTIQQLMTDSESVPNESLDAAEESPVPLSHAISDEQGEALAVADDLMNPETETNLRSPQVLSAMNTIWGPRLGEGKRIVGIIPGRQSGTLAFEIEVTEADGTKRSAPMTRGRATAEDGDNEVLQVPVEAIMDELNDAKALFQAFQQNPEARDRVLSHAISQGYIKQPERRDTFDIRELPNGRYGQFNSVTGELVKELSADEANKNGPGGGGGLDADDARLWYKDINTMAANQFGLQVDEFGEIVGEGGPGLETASAYSDLAAQLWRQNQGQGQVISPQEAFNQVQRAAYGHILSREEAETYAMQELGADAEPGEITQAVDEILRSEFEKVQRRLIEMESGESWLNYASDAPVDDGSNTATNETVSTSNSLPSQDALLSDGPTDQSNQSEPARRTLGLNYESDAPTPIGRTVDRVNQAIGVAPQAPEGPGSNTASPYDHSATQNRQAYFDRAQQAIEAIGGNTVNQAFRSQDGETFGENKGILGFLKDQGMDVLGTNQQMWSLFEADPLGFIDITKRLGRNATPENIASQIRR